MGCQSTLFPCVSVIRVSTRLFFVYASFAPCGMYTRSSQGHNLGLESVCHPCISLSACAQQWSPWEGQQALAFLKSALKIALWEWAFGKESPSLKSWTVHFGDSVLQLGGAWARKVVATRQQLTCVGDQWHLQLLHGHVVHPETGSVFRAESVLWALHLFSCSHGCS